MLHTVSKKHVDQRWNHSKTAQKHVQTQRAPDKLPPVMSLESASVGSEDYKFEIEMNLGSGVNAAE